MTNNQITDTNIRINYLSQAVSALVFFIPVWVAYELQYINLIQVGIIEAIIQACQLILELPTGALADLWGKRTTVILGYLVTTLATVIYTLSRTYPSFIIYALILGLGHALISGAREAWLYDSLKAADRESEFSKISAKSGLSVQISLAVSTLTGGLMGSINILYPLIATAIATGITTIIFFWAKEPRIDSVKFTLPNYLRQTRMGLKEVTKTSHTLALSLFYIAVGGITWAAMMLFNATLMTQAGFTPIEFGVTLAAIRIINSLILYGAINFNKIFNQHQPFIFITVIMLISYLPGVFLTKFLTIFAVAGSLFSSTFRWIILGKLVNQEYASKNRATAISTLSMAISIIIVLLTLISGPIMANFGGAKSMYSLMGLFTLLTILPLAVKLNRPITPVIAGGSRVKPGMTN